MEPNEEQTVVLQRRCVRAARPIAAGTVITEADIEVLRPAPADAIPAHEFAKVLGTTLNRDLVFGEELHWSDVTA